MTAVERLKNCLKKGELPSFEVIPLNRPLSFHHYQDWLKNQHEAEMNYMRENQDLRENPKSQFTTMKSIIVFEQSYFPWPETSSSPLKNLKIAHYARSKDYHLWFQEKLKNIITSLQQEFPGEDFKAFTDAVPLLERDYGAQAALGWVGKNTCLIHPQKGSLFFIGEILTSIACSEDKPQPLPDFCGSCTACMDACPTQALIEPKKLDASLCLSYWNIESKKLPPVEIRDKMGSWFFGCDICQTVCPWNLKLHKLSPHYFHDQDEFNHHQKYIKNASPTEPTEKDLTEELIWILTQSNKSLMKNLSDSPLSRAGGRGLKRNALIVAANMKLQKLKPLIETYEKEPYWTELAQWCLKKLV